MNDADFELLRAASPVRAELAECRRVREAITAKLLQAQAILERVNDFYWPPDNDLEYEERVINEVHEFVIRGTVVP